MRINIKKFGPYARYATMTNNMERNLQQAVRIYLKLFGTAARDAAKGHILKEDLGWLPLAQSTLDAKVSQPFPTQTLMETGKYFANIRYWIEGDSVSVGVKDGVKYNKAGRSRSLSYIAGLHESGNTSSNLPARPLWFPLETEMKIWVLTEDGPDRIYLKKQIARNIKDMNTWGI
jgi:hypothetical protein